MTEELETATRIAVAALGGAAVGIERQWSGHATGWQARFGGVRTFTLLGGTAGIAAVLWERGLEPLAIVLVAGAAVLVVLGYVAASRRNVDATTEVAALVVLAAGLLAGSDHLALASAVIAVTALLLVEKRSLHSWVGRLDDVEIRAGARFAVMAVVILPLLPVGPYGPADSVRPRDLWQLVLLLSGLSFAGYVARRTIGNREGAAVSGLLGGLVSSTSVTLGFARASRGAARDARGLALGVVAASTVMFARLMFVTWALNPSLGRAVVWLLAPPLLGGMAITASGLLLRESKSAAPPGDEPRNPLQIAAALQMAALFQIVLIAVAWVRTRYAGAGVLVSGAVLGLADTDALALSIARSTSAAQDIQIAAVAIAVGGLSNTLVKLGLAIGIGGSGFRLPAGGGLLLLAVLSAIGIALLAPG